MPKKQRAYTADEVQLVLTANKRGERIGIVGPKNSPKRTVMTFNAEGETVQTETIAEYIARQS